MSLALRPYQRAAIDAVAAACARGLRRVLVVMPTGAGKTVAFAHLLRERGGRGLVLAHRDELVSQAVDKLRMVAPELSVGVCKAERDELGAQVVVASVQTLARPARLDRLRAAWRQPQLFGGASGLRTVVADEAHHYPAGEEGNTFGSVLTGLGAFDDDGPLVVGCTATPDPLTKTEDGELAGGWQEVVFQLGILDGIREGWLVDVRAKEVKLAGADFRDLHSSRGEIKADEAASMLLEADAPAHAARAYQQHAAGRRALVFTPTIALAHEMARAFRGAGVTAEAVDGEMPLDERRAILRRLHTGETLVVPNAQVLTEGFDEPSVSAVIMARPTKSRPFALQCIGRGLRPYPGKTDCVVLDLVGSVRRHDLMTVSAMFGCRDEVVEQRGLLAAATQAAEAGALGQAPAPAGELVAREFALFQARAFAWVASGSRFSLSLGDQGMVALEPNPERPELWDVLHVRTVQRGERYFGGRRVPQYVEDRKRLFVGLDMGYATGAAEDYVRKAGAAILSRRDAAWRKRPPTEKQAVLLRKWGLWRDGLTAGDASDVIGARMARRRRSA